MGKTVLCTIVKDSKGVLAKPLKVVLPFLKTIYDNISLIAHASTDQDLLLLVKKDGWIIERENDKGIGAARRQSIGLGLKLDARHLHFCELDRITLWAKNIQKSLGWL